MIDLNDAENRINIGICLTHLAAAKLPPVIYNTLPVGECSVGYSDAIVEVSRALAQYIHDNKGHI